MRKSTLLWLVLATCCGTVLFHTSQKVHDERQKLFELNESIAKEEESLRVLNAEWSYLNQPARLEKLARNYLNMAPLKGSQFIKIDDIPLRSAAPVVAAEETPAPEKPVIAEKITPAEKPAVTEKPAVKEKSVIAAKPHVLAPHIAVVASPKPVVKIRKPEAVIVATPKPPHTPAPAAAAANTRSFDDLMKNLRTGVE